MGIRHVGAKTAKILAQRFHTIDALSQATFEQLSNIDSIGDVLAQSLIDWFAISQNQELIQKLKSFGVNLVYHGPKIQQNTAITGKSFVITGTLTKLRDFFKEQIELNGGKVSASVSKKTDYVLVGENPGSKEIKAHKLGVKVLNEKDSLKLIEGSKNE